jgi:hypothetical protein
VLPLSSFRLPAANAPTLASFVGNLNKETYAVNDYQEFTTELQHGYKAGSTFEFHIHGALNATVSGGDEKVKFEIEYTIANMSSPTGGLGLGDVFPSTTIVSKEVTIPDTTADLRNLYIEVGSDSTGSFSMGATICGRIRRIAASANELTADPFVTQVGVHYQRDTVGSRQTTTK